MIITVGSKTKFGKWLERTGFRKPLRISIDILKTGIRLNSEDKNILGVITLEFTESDTLFHEIKTHSND